MPIFNNQVLNFALIACNALNLKISQKMHWDRKSYFYPDNAKGFQITQFETPIGFDGEIDILVDNTIKKIRIERLHMEEDTAKSTHTDNGTLLDFNRAGTPLIEIVSHPDLTSGEDVVEYVSMIRASLMYYGLCDGRLENGSMRVDVNVSVRPSGQVELNTKVEIKNLNSFNNIKTAIDLEVANQLLAYKAGSIVKEETKRYNETKKVNISMRSKETLNDYRYIAEPDLPAIILSDDQLSSSKKVVDRFLFTDYIDLITVKKLPIASVQKLMGDIDMYKFFVRCCDSGISEKVICNFLTSNIQSFLNSNNLQFSDLKLTVSNIADLIKNEADGTINSSHIRLIFPILLESNKSIAEIITEQGFQSNNNDQEIILMINEVLTNNQQSIVDYQNGKDRAFGFLVGQIMKTSKGQMNPQKISELLKEILKNR